MNKKQLLIVIIFLAFGYFFARNTTTVEATHLLNASCTGEHAQDILNECEQQGTAVCHLNCIQNTGSWQCNPVSCRDSINGDCPAGAPPGGCTPIVPKCGACDNTANFACHTCTPSGTPISCDDCNNNPILENGKYYQRCQAHDGSCGIQKDVKGPECTPPPPPPPSCGQACSAGQCGSGMTCRTFSGGSICAMNEYVDNSYCGSNNNEAACCHAPPPPPPPTATLTPVPPVCGPSNVCKICDSPATCTVGQPCRVELGPQGAFCSDGRVGGYCYNDSTCAQVTSTPIPAATVTPHPTPTEGACVVGSTACTCSGSGAGSCAQCNGGWCSNSVCEQCSPCVGSACGGGPPSCSRGEECGAPKAGITPIIANGESCYPVSYPGDITGQCCHSGARSNPWTISSCSAPVTPTVAPPSPTPTYILVTNFATPTPKPKTPGQPSQSWECMHSETYNGDIRPVPDQLDHRLSLSAAHLPNNTDIYIVGCVLLNNSFNCTTGNTALDDTFGIQKASEHDFAVANGPVKQATDNALTGIIVRSRTTTSTVHSFYAVYIAPPTGEGSNGGASSLQFATMTAEDKSVSVSCAAVRWDPFGRVFDNTSLEPVSNAQVNLNDASHQLTIIPGIMNPYKTKASGAFSFLVPPGTYYLNLTNTPYHVVSKSQVHPDAVKAYYDIYTPGEAIVEKAGSAQHRDIAVDTGMYGPVHTNPTSLDFAIVPMPDTHETKLIGQVSHPLTIISFRQQTREIAKTVADQYGFYEIQIPTSTITPGIDIVPYFTKVNLATTKNSNAPSQNILETFVSYIKAVFEKNTSAAPAPAEGSATAVMPRYLEGIIYSDGKPMPNSTVDIKLSMSDKTVYETTSDAQGFISISPQYIPIFDYYLSVNNSVNINPGSFMQDNASYLAAHRINLITATKDGKDVSQ